MSHSERIPLQHFVYTGIFTRSDGIIRSDKDLRIISKIEHYIRSERIGKCLSYDVLALSGEDGVPPTRCELAGSGRGRVVKVLAVMGRARV